MGAILEAVFAYISKKERNKMSKDDFGDPENEGYPVKDKKHYTLALQMVGKAPPNKQAAIRKRILEIGKRKGYDK